jgi:hypothetical protein
MNFASKSVARNTYGESMAYLPMALLKLFDL